MKQNTGILKNNQGEYSFSFRECAADNYKIRIVEERRFDLVPKNNYILPKLSSYEVRNIHEDEIVAVKGTLFLENQQFFVTDPFGGKSLYKYLEQRYIEEISCDNIIQMFEDLLAVTENHSNVILSHQSIQFTDDFRVGVLDFSNISEIEQQPYVNPKNKQDAEYACILFALQLFARDKLLPFPEDYPNKDEYSTRLNSIINNKNIFELCLSSLQGDLKIKEFESCLKPKLRPFIAENDKKNLITNNFVIDDNYHDSLVESSPIETLLSKNSSEKLTEDHGESNSVKIPGANKPAQVKTKTPNNNRPVHVEKRTKKTHTPQEAISSSQNLIQEQTKKCEIIVKERNKKFRINVRIKKKKQQVQERIKIAIVSFCGFTLVSFTYFFVACLPPIEEKIKPSTLEIVEKKLEDTKPINQETNLEIRKSSEKNLLNNFQKKIFQPNISTTTLQYTANILDSIILKNSESAYLGDYYHFLAKVKFAQVYTDKYNQIEPSQKQNLLRLVREFIEKAYDAYNNKGSKTEFYWNTMPWMWNAKHEKVFDWTKKFPEKQFEEVTNVKEELILFRDMYVNKFSIKW